MSEGQVNPEVTVEAGTEVTLSKISVATINARPTRIQNEPALEFEPLARVGGVATGIKLVANKQTGETHIALVGQFIALSLKTAVTYNSGVLYLPAGIHEQITSAVSAEGAKPVEFMIELRAVHATNPAKFSYAAVALHRPEAVADPLAKFRRFVTVVKQLPPPPTATTVEDVRAAERAVKEDAKHRRVKGEDIPY